MQRLVDNAPESAPFTGWRRRTRRGRGLLLIAAGLAALFGAWAYERAGPGECRAVQRSDLSLAQMGSVKRRLDNLERDPEAALALTGEEMTFLLADNLAFPVSIVVDGDEISAELALQKIGTERCYHVHYRGGLQVEGGIATLHPSQVAVGRLDLSGFFRGRSLRVEPARLSDEARRVLSHIRMLQVSDDALQLQIDDVASLNPRRSASPGASIHAER